MQEWSSRQWRQEADLLDRKPRMASILGNAPRDFVSAGSLRGHGRVDGSSKVQSCLQLLGLAPLDFSRVGGVI